MSQDDESAGATSTIFISHTHSDEGLSRAWRDLVDDLFGDAYRCHSSTSEEPGSRPEPGQNWAGWIQDTIAHASVALVLLTPSSIRKPWVLWEAGAVWGLTARRQGQAVLRPILYSLPKKLVPEPFHPLQMLRGDEESGVKRLCQSLMDQHPSLSERQRNRFQTKVDDRVAQHMDEVRHIMLKLPVCETEDAIREWQSRLDTLAAEHRVSEVRHRHHWMDIAFDQSAEDPRPLDLGLHRRLGEIYMASGDYVQAGQQLELARHLAPRDIYILRALGEAYLKQGPAGRGKAQQIVDAIDDLDPEAAINNVECAALKGKWLVSLGNYEKAVRLYAASLERNPTSYYIADLLAQVRLAQDLPDKARDVYERALEIVGRLKDDSVWRHATGAAAAIATGKAGTATDHLTAIHRLRPNGDQLDSIKATLDKLRSDFDLPWEEFAQWHAAMEGRVAENAP